MLTYNKMLKLHKELASSLSELQQHLEHVLGDIGYEFGVSTQFKVIVETSTRFLRAEVVVQVRPRPRCLVVSSNKCLKEVTQLR